MSFVDSFSPDQNVINLGMTLVPIGEGTYSIAFCKHNSPHHSPFLRQNPEENAPGKTTTYIFNMLSPVNLALFPSCFSSLAWSSDGDLAVAAGEFVHIVVCTATPYDLYSLIKS